MDVSTRLDRKELSSRRLSKGLSMDTTKLLHSASNSAGTPQKTPRSYRPGKKEKQQLKQQHQQTSLQVQVPATREEPDAWSWYPLADPSTTTCPVLFSRDQDYAFITSGSSVQIYSQSTYTLLSTLSCPSSTAHARQSKITSVLLNPSNPLQLVVASLDGTIRLWDYREGKLLRTLDLGAPVQHACANRNLPNQIFVALIAKDPSTPSTSSDATDVPAGIYSISLKPKPLPADTPSPTPLTPRTPARRVRLAQPRIVRALTLSPTGAYLIALNPNLVNICHTESIQKGFSVKLESAEKLTTVACHPTENYFVTGNEKGQLRLWYDVLTPPSATAPKPTTPSVATTALLHWHAHAVSTISFTPNGAYLISGGKESVLVMWQLHSGHKEFVPRLGAPIEAVSVSEGKNEEQKMLVRLRDGTVAVVGSQKLKVSKVIAGLKADPVRLTDLTNRPSLLVPLALQPHTQSLVLPSGHPSSIQFYSPSSDSQQLEIEVAPSNRVSGMDSEPEPTRVERVSFSDEKSVGGAGYWMATLDSWENEKSGYREKRHLKFWRFRSQNSFTLVTRIERPHESRLTSMSFSSSTPPILLTTSIDGLTKLWTLHASSWTCRASLSYRSFTPLDSAWSLDGSMFAVAYKKLVTIWSTASGKLIRALGCAGVGEVKKVRFFGEEGTGLLVGGSNGTMAWDLLTYEETFGVAIQVNDIAVKPRSSTLVITESKPSSNNADSSVSTHAFVVDASTASCDSHILPFPVRQSLWLDSATAAKTDVSLAVVNEKGEVVLVGAAAKASLEAKAPASKLPSAVVGQSRLFDEIFGVQVQQQQQTPLIAAPATTTKAKGLKVLDAPAHTLPAARHLWKSAFGAFKVAVAPAETMQIGEKALVTDVEMEEAQEEETSVDDVVYNLERGNSLAEVFRKKLTLGSTPVVTSSTKVEKKTPVKVTKKH